MSIQLTDVAAQRVKYFLEKENGMALRLGVRKTGCSGWAYEVSIAEEFENDDHVFEDKDVKIVVDDDSLPDNLVATHRSLFVGSLQGVARTDCPAFSFQGHPEASPGPHDVAPLFDHFIELIERHKLKSSLA